MISYHVAPDDYLTYQLYMASHSKEIRAKRRRTWLLIPCIYLIFGGLAFYFGKQKNIALVFSILAGLWLIIYPLYTRWTYKDKFKKAIIKNNKEIFGKKITLAIDGEKLVINDTLNKNSSLITDIVTINEIKSHYFIKLKKGSSIIIPKKEFSTPADLVKFIGQISKSSKAKINKELGWKWT